MVIHWTDGFEIKAEIINGEIVITANTEGLLSLSEQLKNLAEEAPGSHIHYDQYDALEEGSTDMIIVKA